MGSSARLMATRVGTDHGSERGTELQGAGIASPNSMASSEAKRPSQARERYRRMTTATAALATGTARAAMMSMRMSVADGSSRVPLGGALTSEAFTQRGTAWRKVTTSRVTTPA